MSDEIYINHGSAFQQPYQGQIIRNAQQPNIRNIQMVLIRGQSAQNPFTYQNRTSFTYRSPVSTQEPNIRKTNRVLSHMKDKEEVRLHINTHLHIQDKVKIRLHINNKVLLYIEVQLSHGQQPTIKNAQQPYPYIANGQQPNIRNKLWVTVYLSIRKSFYI